MFSAKAATTVAAVATVRRVNAKQGVRVIRCFLENERWSGRLRHAMVHGKDSVVDWRRLSCDVAAMVRYPKVETVQRTRARWLRLAQGPCDDGVAHPS